MSAIIERPVIAVSTRVYRGMLGAYPEAFRNEYETELVLVFRDRCREVLALEGAWGLIAFWIPVLLDLVKTSIEEHRQTGGTGMLKSTLIRLAGPLLLVGGILLMLGSGYGWIEQSRLWKFGVFGMFTMYFPMALGLLGLYLGHKQDIDTPSRVGLILAIVGAAGAFLSAFIMWFGDTIPDLGDTLIATFAWMENIWIVWWIGGMLVYLGMIVFGVLALQNKPLPRWNILPLLIGIGPLVLLGMTELDLYYLTEHRAAVALLAIMGLLWVGLGVSLLPQMVRQPATA